MSSLAALDDAQPGYMEADAFYDGEIGDEFGTETIKRLLAKAQINEIDDLNYAKVPVDTIAEKLKIRAVSVSSGDEAKDDEQDAGAAGGGKDSSRDAQTLAAKKKIAERAQEALDALRKRNQLKIEEREAILRSSKHGDSYLFVWPVVAAPDDEEETFEGGQPLDPTSANPGKIVSVDIFVNSAYTVRAFYDTENPLKMTHVVKSWEWIDLSDRKRRRATLYFSDRTERWVTRPDGDAARIEDWIPFVETDEDGEQLEEWPTPNPYGRIPFFHIRNGRSYGSPEHKSAYGPQRLINKLISAHAVTIDYQSFPQRYALQNPKTDDAMM